MALIEIGVGPKGPEKAKSCIPKPPFSTGFIRFSDMVECRVRLIYKPNAFWSFWCHFAILHPESSEFHRFYNVFPSTFLVISKHCFTNGFLMFCKVVKRHQLLVKTLMLAWYFLRPFRENGPKRLHKRQVYKVILSTFLDAAKHCFTKGFWCYPKT